MAETGFPFSLISMFLVFSTSSLFYSPALSRTSFTRTTLSTTTVLHVSRSIENAQNLILSSRPHSVHKTTTLPPPSTSTSPPSSFSSSSLTLQLLPRLSLPHASPHPDYKSLTLSRLLRDSARVNSLAATLDLTAVAAVKVSDLFGSEDLEATVTSGTNQGSGEYFTRLGIGSPPQSVFMVVDTGSDVSWLQCAPCAECYAQADPIFQPASSSSYAPLSCSSAECRSLDVSACRNGSCLYEVSYGDGSFTVGDFVTETVSLGSSSVGGVAIGCGHNNEGLFVAAAGLLGLGGGPLSFPAQLNADSFSYCLVERDSGESSTLEFDSAGGSGASAITAPLIRNAQFDTFYYVGLAGISVGGEAVDIPAAAFGQLEKGGSGGVIVDSGTAVTRLASAAYRPLRDAFVKGTRHLKRASGVSLFDTCYDLSGREMVNVPAVSFLFGGGGKESSSELDLPAANYMIPVDDSGTFCFAFAETSSQLSIIGNVQQQKIRVTIDLAKSQVGFSPNAC